VSDTNSALCLAETMEETTPEQEDSKYKVGKISENGQTIGLGCTSL
ncbi:13858_t:CDS:2, partial [Gigaspora rosea]